MRDFASCFSEHAVKVSDTSCSGGSSSALDTFSVQSTVATLYRCLLSSGKDIFIRVTWSKTLAGPALSIAVDDIANTQLLKKTRGSRSFVSGDKVLGLYWDVSGAKYTPCSPEPIEEFYVIVIADTEFALLLGDASRDYIKKFEDRVRVADFAMIGRREKVVGNSLYATKAPFGEGGREHHIVIKWRGSNGGSESELSVSVDKKKVVHVRRLNWNFRGNQIIFVDGSPVDMMWDVHGWFGGQSGHAVFMFRSRSALESRLWLEEEIAAAVNKEHGLPCFSLLIQAFRN